MGRFFFSGFAGRPGLRDAVWREPQLEQGSEEAGPAFGPRENGAN